MTDNEDITVSRATVEVEPEAPGVGEPEAPSTPEPEEAALGPEEEQAGESGHLLFRFEAFEGNNALEIRLGINDEQFCCGRHAVDMLLDMALAAHAATAAEYMASDAAAAAGNGDCSGD